MCLLLAIWAWPAPPVAAVPDQPTLRVGPKQRFTTPCQAIERAKPGTVIEIEAGGDYSGDVCSWTTNNLTLRGVGGRASIDAAGRSARGMGTWVISGNGTTVENIEFSGSRVASRNGAGIKLLGAGLTVRNCYFHHNENGILTGHEGGEVLIEFSEFDRNGHPNGYAHNLYIGRADKLTFRFNYSHDTRGGHLLKSRALENHILYNRLSSENGASSYEVDIPNGGLTFLIGNLIQQGKRSVNRGIVSYAMEGPTNPSQELLMINNTIVNDSTIGTNVFLKLPAELARPATLRNNLFTGSGSISNQREARLEGNLFLDAPGLADRSHLDYRIFAKSPAVDRGVPPGSLGGQPLDPLFHYVHPACGERREPNGRIDVGAYEFGGSAAWPGQPQRCTGAAALPNP